MAQFLPHAQHTLLSTATARQRNALRPGDHALQTRDYAG
jgi:hypothetical protein